MEELNPEEMELVGGGEADFSNVVGGSSSTEEEIKVPCSSLRMPYFDFRCTR